MGALSRRVTTPRAATATPHRVHCNDNTMTMSDNTDPTRIVEYRLVNAWGNEETYLFRNPTEAKEWIEDYTHLCKAFDDISIKWHELPEGTIPEFTYAISQNIRRKPAKRPGDCFCT